MQKNQLLLEACVETLEQCIQAEKQGAQRLELCAKLKEGGLSPSIELIQAVQEAVQIPIKVMVRPRGGNFVYTKAEIDQMAEEIKKLKAINIPEIVLGLLTAKNKIDLEATHYLAKIAAPLPITFHKAIDEVDDPLEELQKLTTIPNIKTILTSGGAPTALAGQEVLRKMRAKFQDRFTILPAGKITLHNLEEVHQAIGAQEYHGRKIVGKL